MKKNISEERLRKQALKKFSRKLTKKFGYGSTSILEHFSSIKDARVAQGKRHELIIILVIAICATICGADGWVEIVEFGKGKEKWLSSFLNMPHGVPEEDTFRRVFNAIDPEDFQRKFISWINMNSRLSKGNVIAIDGKTMKGSRDNYKNKKPLHIVSAWASDHRLSLGQVAVDEKSNEITAIPELLKGLCIEGCIITIDAMGCHIKIAATIVEKKRELYFLFKRESRHFE
jgi:predicted transposase YbfD/YdcC